MDGGWTSDKIIEGILCQCSSCENGCEVSSRVDTTFYNSTTVEGVSADATDTTELWVRSRWYEAVAREAAKQATIDERWIDVFMAPWVVPMEFDTAKSAQSRYTNRT